MAKTTRTKPWEAVSSSIAYWKSLSRLWEIWWTRTAGKEAVDAARRSRFNALVRFARSQSPFYRDAFHGLPERELDPRELPVVTKPRLMARFDDWVTDPEINLAGVTAFVADREHIGERYHLASIASWQRVSQSSPWIAARGFSIMDPLPRLVAELNDYRPVFLASYPTMLSLLAEEREAGRLSIEPVRLWSGGECLVPNAGAAIERAFGCPLTNEYGASECMSIAFGCREGWLHINADWVLLEPVESDYCPTPLGEASHTVLLSNLANRVQPIIRYDLGDSIIAKAEPCACGNPLPAIRVEGRRDDVLSMRTPDGGLVRLLPLALTTIVEEAAHVHRFQIVQTAADRLMLRLDPCGDDDRHAVWHAAAGALRDYLAQQSLPNVHVGLDKHGPLVDHRSGKLREDIVAMERSPAHA